MKLPRALALSTRYATSARMLAPEAILDVIERADAGGIVLDSSLPRDLLGALQILVERRRDQFPVVALEAPCPRGPAMHAREPELCAPERDEAEAALEAAVATVRRAGDLHARFVVISLGAVRPAARDWIYARDRFLRADLDEDLARRMLLARDDVADRALDTARRALDQLSREAERAGVILTVRNGRRYIDLPSPRELDQLREDLRGAPIAPMLDVPAAHLADLMHFHPLALTLAAWGKAPLVYFGDACGPVGALAPGRGVIDLKTVRAAIAPDAAIAFSPWPGLTLEEVSAAIPLIKHEFKQ